MSLLSNKEVVVVLPLKSLDFLVIVPDIRPYAMPMIRSGMMKLNIKDTIL